MSEDFDREEQAFRDAFRSDLEGEAFRPLDPDEIRTAVGPVRRLSGPWLKGLAAAAAVVLVVGGAGVVLPQLFRAGSAASGSMAAAPSQASGDDAGGTTEKDVASAAAPVPGPSGANAAASDWVTTAPSPLSPRMYASGAWVDGKFYVVGGRGLLEDCRKTDRFCPQDRNTLLDGASYDPGTDTWTPLPDSPAAVAMDAPVVVGSRIYFWSDTGSGGQEPAQLLAFDTATSTWSESAGPRYPGELVAVGDRLVNVSPGDGPVVDQVLDATIGTWSDLPVDPLGTNEVRTGTGYGHNLILAARAESAVPGTGSYTRFAELDLDTGSWQVLPGSRIVGVGPTTVGDYLVVGAYESVTGEDGKKYAVGGRFDLASGTWSTIPAPDFSSYLVQGSSGAVVGDWLMIKGNLFNVATGEWAGLQLPGSRSVLGATVVGGPDGLLVFNGEDGDQLSADTYYLSIP